jgi:hypothetical protein
MASSRRAACPHCRNTTELFEQIDRIPGYAQFTPTVQPDGSVVPEWTGETRVIWDAQKPASDPPEFFCTACEHTFTTFVLVTVDDDLDAVDDESFDE